MTSERPTWQPKDLKSDSLAPLRDWGYDEHFAAAHAEVVADTGVPLVPVRIVRIDRGRALCSDGRDTFGVPLLPHDPEVGVGDFASCTPGRERIAALLPRRQVLTRRRAGTHHGVQLLCANVDVVLLCAPADRLNIGWIERGVSLSWDCDAEPIVVLTKVDILEDTANSLRDIEDRVVGVPVLPVSAQLGKGVEALSAHLEAGRTAVLLGASGAGKSTLLNALMGEPVMAVGEVRDGDRKGRHTTTRRELFVIPGGAILIDSPGTRELGLTLSDDDAGSGFLDIDALAEACKFSDCAHQSEPGCAVRAALDSGTLPAERFASYERQIRERRWLGEDTYARRERERGFARMVKSAKSRKKPRN